jgi:hypothetical protein
LIFGEHGRYLWNICSKEPSSFTCGCFRRTGSIWLKRSLVTLCEWGFRSTSRRSVEAARPGDRIEFRVSGRSITIIPKLSADELEDEREIDDPKVCAIVKDGRQEFRTRKSRPAREFFAERAARATRRTRKRSGGSLPEGGRDVFVFLKHEDTPAGAVYAEELIKRFGTLH